MAEMKVVVFRVAGHHYAADIRDVQEVIRSPAITALPHPTPPTVGVFNLRGHIVTALDGHAALGFGAGTAAASPRTVVFHAGGRTVGLLVEAANQVVTVGEGSIRPVTEGRLGPTAKGIIIHEDRPIVLLDVPVLVGQRPASEARPPP